MSSRNLLLVGVGGQGTILASKMLTDVALAGGYDIKMSEIHGMAQRGGSVVTQVRIGEAICSPLIERGEADIILAFEQLEALRWLEYLKPEGTIILNTQTIEPVPVLLGKAQYPKGIVEAIRTKTKNVQGADALELASQCGNAKSSNVVMMGILARRLDFPKESWLKSLQTRVPAATIKVNIKAFAAGYKL